MIHASNLFSHRTYWAARFGVAPVLPMSRSEMEELGWDSCDIIIVTGDAYVDHPSFGMALIGRLLEAQGFRVGIIAQPDWSSAQALRQLGKPNLFFGITAGNMDSMVNRYTADRRIRSDDAYTPNGEAGKRPDRSVIVYAQRAREAYKGVPVVIGGIEASLRRIAHYDYWSDKVRRSVLPDSKADLLIYGNGERAVVELAHRLAAGEKIGEITDIRGTGLMRQGLPQGWSEIDSTQLDKPGPKQHHPDPYQAEPACRANPLSFTPHQRPAGLDRSRTVVRLPGYDQVVVDELLYAHASRVFHLETNPGNARTLVQRHGKRDVWLNPPPIPLTTEELDRVYELPYSRQPHPVYGEARNPAWEMIRFSVNIMRGCFGGCTFCSITEHEGRIIQSRSENSVVREVEAIRDQTPGFTGNISDLGGPTANMYRLACKDKKIESACRRLSCVYPNICNNLNTDHRPLIRLYRRTRSLAGIKRVFIASGLRYDLAVRSPEYIRELVTHHVGGYLKIAPEHTEDGPLGKMMKPGIDSYQRFKRLFDKYSDEAGKEQYLIPYFIAAHPGTSDKDMLNLALWLKRNGFRPDQVQAFLPTPLAIASAMYHSGRNPLQRIHPSAERVRVVKGLRQRRLHKAFLRYHDPENWPLLRDALNKMGRGDLIGNGKRHLLPSWQPGKAKTEKTGIKRVSGKPNGRAKKAVARKRKQGPRRDPSGGRRP
ncbi:MAG: YgiQ family radical SAM protein [Candidatus Thiodiazotropha sp.]